MIGDYNQQLLYEIEVFIVYEVDFVTFTVCIDKTRSIVNYNYVCKLGYCFALGFI